MNKLEWDKCPDTIFENYVQMCEIFSKVTFEFENFKRHPKYQTILEGGEHIVGLMAIDNINNKSKFKDLLLNQDKFKENDLYGNPITHNYNGIGEISPSTLRYINTLYDIQKLVGDFKPKTFIEVGGGYGGLCKVISSLYNFEEYTLVDLPNVIELCKVYISKFDELKNKVKFIKSTDDFTPKEYDVFISDSALAECNIDYQDKCLENFIKHSKFSYTTFNTSHFGEFNSEVENFMKKLSHKNVSQFKFDDKTCITTTL